jgi:hypothetical protein
VSSFIRPARPNQHSIILFSAELFSDTRLSQQPTGGVHLHIEDWLAGVQRSSRQKKPLKMQNKPNSLNALMNVNTVTTKNYENKRLADMAETNPIQTQFKPNSKPIQTQNEPKTNPIKPRVSRKEFSIGSVRSTIAQLLKNRNVLKTGMFAGAC